MINPIKNHSVKKIEAVQYKAALAITGAIQGTSRDKIYQELAFESLKSRRWYKRLTCMFKIMRNEAPDYLINLVPKCEYAINTRNIYQCTIVAQIVLSILSFRLH